jgi:hypothetical protein
MLPESGCFSGMKFRLIFVTHPSGYFGASADETSETAGKPNEKDG